MTLQGHVTHKDAAPASTNPGASKLSFFSLMLIIPVL